MTKNTHAQISAIQIPIFSCNNGKTAVRTTTLAPLADGIRRGVFNTFDNEPLKAYSTEINELRALEPKANSVWNFMQRHKIDTITSSLPAFNLAREPLDISDEPSFRYTGLVVVSVSVDKKRKPSEVKARLTAKFEKQVVMAFLSLTAKSVFFVFLCDAVCAQSYKDQYTVIRNELESIGFFAHPDPQYYNVPFTHDPQCYFNANAVLFGTESVWTDEFARILSIAAERGLAANIPQTKLF